MDPDDYDRLGITDPKLVMDAIRKRNDVVKNTGKSVGLLEGLDRITGFSEGVEETWEDTKEAASDAWESTKNAASDTWDWITDCEHGGEHDDGVTHVS